MTAADPSASSIVNALKVRFEDALARHLPGPAEIAFIGFPNHPNVGDSAIWLGEQAWLQSAGHRLVYVADVQSYSSRALRHAMGAETVIVLHGGGNFGDLWPEHQALREHVMLTFGGRKIIQMPQTVYFRESESEERARAAVAACTDLVVMARDRESLNRLETSFEVRAELVPDAAFAIGMIARPSRPSVEVLWLARTDTETSRPLNPPGTLETVDWLVEDHDEIHGISAARVRAQVTRWGRRSRRIPAVTPFAQRLLIPAFNLLARRRVEDGLALLSTGEFVVTDRLHAHILCLLMQIPHVAVDTGYGKIRAVHETWTKGWTRGRLAEGPAEIPRLLAEFRAADG